MEEFNTKGFVVIISNNSDYTTRIIREDDIDTCMLSNCYDGYGNKLSIEESLSESQEGEIEELEQEAEALTEQAEGLEEDSLERKRIEDRLSQIEEEIEEIRDNPDYSKDEQVQAYHIWNSSSNQESIIISDEGPYRIMDEEEAEPILKDYFYARENGWQGERSFVETWEGEKYIFESHNHQGEWGIYVEEIKN